LIVDITYWLPVSMDITDWRKKIDELDRKLVELLNQRAQAAHEIGRLMSQIANERSLPTSNK
jgi:chorismate mutase